MEDEDEPDVVRRRLDVEGTSPSDQIARIVGEMEGKEPTELSRMYDRVDGVVEDIFSTPPSPEANLRIEFTYEGYRITVDQDGTATFVKTG